MATSDTSSTATSPTNAAVVTGPVVTTENSTFSRLGHALSLVQQIEALGEDPPARSWVWKYGFCVALVVDPTVKMKAKSFHFVCKRCSATFNAQSTSAARSHLEEQHRIFDDKPHSNSNDPQATTSRKRAATNHSISEMLSRNKNKKSTAVVPRTQGERFRYLLVCWMATANIPFAAVENKYYRQILQLFNAPLTDALLPKGGGYNKKLAHKPSFKQPTRSSSSPWHRNPWHTTTQRKREGFFMEWRKSGPIGKLHFLVHHIRRSPQRRDLFSDIAKGKLTEEEQQEFGAILIDKDIAKLQLRSDNETRWHSVYHMIDRAIMLRDPLDYFVNIVTKKDPDNITSDDQLTPSEWVVLKEIRCILEPFKIITKKFEGRKPNFADVVSHAYTLHRNLNELYQQYARTASQHHDFHGGPWVGIRPPSPALGNSLNPGRMQSLSSDPDPDIEPPSQRVEPPSQRRSGRTIRPSQLTWTTLKVDLPALGYRPSTTEPHPAPSPRPQQRVVQLGEVIDDEVDDTGYAFIQKSLKLAIEKLEKYLAIMDATPAYWAAMILLPNCKMRWIERFFTDDPLKSSDIQARFRVFFDHNYPRPAPDSSNGSRDRPSHRPAFGYDFYDPPDRVSVDELVQLQTAFSYSIPLPSKEKYTAS
ncbi:hypothetical protein CHGG_08485 [Chaetomium globosum CBS 148.51]|uniref:Uncharacterized protein n=1 Tax=Chaetomium globosum (strain ATCC 6205 / CBS 148.51 / DSM 1962 / NBRC 6347 / NRRL 1970) TaxID=306901 RepID=Q2GU69_CHAGB|nr:uncharacterized protein CHGG_08485 [Chaetomium globosum CBS 148.51]EAQ84471.1 hypothetical protein CHGG_08485 [Chaetomium globosum CBS 148.51]